MIQDMTTGEVVSDIRESSTYSDICKQRCEWCAAGWLLGGPLNTDHFPMNIPGLHPLMDCRKCTAPTPEQVIEEQGREIARLKGLIAGVEHDSGCAVYDYFGKDCRGMRGRPMPRGREVMQGWQPPRMADDGEGRMRLPEIESGEIMSELRCKICRNFPYRCWRCAVRSIGQVIRAGKRKS